MELTDYFVNRCRGSAFVILHLLNCTVDGCSDIGFILTILRRQKVGVTWLLEPCSSPVAPTWFSLLPMKLSPFMSTSCMFFFFFHGVEHHCKYCAWSTQNSRRNRHLYFRIAYRLGEYLLVKSFPQYFVKLSNEKNLQCHSISFSALILLTLFLRKCYQSNAYQHTSFWLW